METQSTKTGSAAAAILAAGIGSLAFGATVVLSEASPAIKKFFTLSKAVGPLSGKVGYGMIAWILVWVALHMVLRNKEVAVSRVYIPALILIALGFLGTFPPFFLLFEP